MMQVKNLSFHYKGCPDVLKDVSFDMEPGKFLAILGNNGVGKSTLLKCFNHILKPDSGEVLLDGENLLKQSSREVAKKVAFVSQSVPSTQMTVHDVVMLGRRPYMKWGFTEEDHKIVHDAMHRLDVEDSHIPSHWQIERKRNDSRRIRCMYRCRSLRKSQGSSFPLFLVMVRKWPSALGPSLW